ncbi:RluA family pseudouridine synthase [soil metagenome]
MPPLLIDWLTEKYPTSKKTTLKRMVEQGRVTINGRPADRLKTPLEPKDVVEVRDRNDSATASKRPSLTPLVLVYEDADLLVIDKPPGLLTSTVPREKRPTALAIVKAYLAGDHRARVGLVHRLDRDASGVLIFAKSATAYDSLKAQFFHHHVSRVYEAIVHGKPKEAKGTIESLLVESKEGKVFATRDISTGQPAVTHFEVVESSGGQSTLRVRLETGRKHQIRAHLSGMGNPIVGDTVYGPIPPAAPQLRLRAMELEIEHPRTGKRVTFRAPEK